MSLFSVAATKHTAYYDHLMGMATTTTGTSKNDTRSSSDSSSDDSRLSGDKSKQINRTYVVSAPPKSSGQQSSGSAMRPPQSCATPTRGRLTLQKRKTGADKTMSDVQNATASTQNTTTCTTPAPEKRLTLQRRTGSVDRTVRSDASKGPQGQSWINGTEAKGLFRSTSLKDSSTSRGRAHQLTAPLNMPGKGVAGPEIRTPFSTNGRSLAVPANPKDHVKNVTPNRKTTFQKISVRKDMFEKLARKEVPKLQSASSDAKPTPAPRTKILAGIQKSCHPDPDTLTSTSAAPPASEPAAPPASELAAPPASVTAAPASVPSAPTSGPATLASVPTPVSVEPLVRPHEVLGKRVTVNMEDSAVTVAVRLRPFGIREMKEKAVQVVFMNHQETIIQHPVSKQSHSFTYDFSFCSVDESDSAFASQQTVYETLARPLLERAFEGFNTCLFAYGQTGSGKSYTMMGFGEQAGVIPRFCEELFARLSHIQNPEVTCHLEMSYFEAYNEKIHDLLVPRACRDSLTRIPLRVREHPLNGPYVAELSAHVVSSYQDIQGWLDLGNKQRATAATGMNDKSSRSHSVFTLVMTQTKTEFVEGEEHEHRITSRINLVDLAGSERCNTAKTSGDRLREGASINKSLLTLGKVIYALSEQSLTKKKCFIPYRDSVLTWLLKESLGGNSKTTMIATLSPAASNMEETLSTLRYAQQARMIINVAKVNEDTNAKLIRELKAEVEKLRSAQMSSQGVEPERVRGYQQEISALRSRLLSQERQMAEASRAWREKLEQAEIRKREEAEELQRAGVTFKVDNSLPNLVNLNEDPQLSEMLLYMVREGQTRVGKRKFDSLHDIQLSGALIADQHCVISNVKGTVSITPMEDAKTYVNGKIISDSTVLHHGDRLIMGGDHYFRFNHPTEVKAGKRVSCWTGAGDGQKDFEFAKNELLSAQRAQLEAEMEEAQVKAKQEMMQGIQMAKEVAQQELQEQKSLYEARIKSLETELKGEEDRKRLQEQDQQRVASQMAQLQVDKKELEQAVDTQKKHLRLAMESEEHQERQLRHAKFIEALEEEKRKLNRELVEIQKEKTLGENRTPVKKDPSQWGAMKMSLMIEEANKISTKLKKNTVFSRHESADKENMEQGDDGLQVRVQNTKLRISTFWSPEKFQNNLATMREQEQGDASKDDEVFYCPDDEWEQDLPDSAASSFSRATTSFSRRRSRSLLKSKRISGRLYEIRVHPIQSLLSSSSLSAGLSSGLMGVSQPPSINPSSSDSALPGICKELIGQTLSGLRRSTRPEETMADRLASDLCMVYTAVRRIAELYDGLDEDSQENVFVCNPEAQTQMVKATSAIERAVFVTMQWLAAVKASYGQLYSISEELRRQVKRMGGFFQLLIQGCESEISSMVTEAQRKSGQTLDGALRALCQLAAMTGTALNTAELGTWATGKLSVATSLLEGTNKGVQSLLKEGLTINNDLLREAQLFYPRTPVLQNLKSQTVDLACALQKYIHCHMSEQEVSPESVGEEEDLELQLQGLGNTAARLFQFNQAVRQLHHSLSTSLRGKVWDSELGVCTHAISSSARAVDEHISGGLHKGTTSSSTVSYSLRLPCVQSVLATRDALHTALQGLAKGTFNQQGAAETRGSASTEKSASGETTSSSKEVIGSHSYRNRTFSKTVYKSSPHFV